MAKKKDSTIQTELNPQRLFMGSAAALVATAMAFVTVGAVTLALKQDFSLTNQQVAWIGGISLWGFIGSQLIFSPLCDTRGIRPLIRSAFVCHLTGTLLMVFADRFGLLVAGALVLSLGNGLVIATCNPLTTALYPEEKIVRLNRLYAWFPGGILLGGLAVYGLSFLSLDTWPVRLGLILIPTLLYGFLMWSEPFPSTSGLQIGVSLKQTFRTSFSTPLMWLLLLGTALAASLEWGSNQWLPAMLELGGFDALLILIWINGLIILLRFGSGMVMSRFSPILVLLISSLLSGIGLFWFSYAETLWSAIGSVTLFVVGICYFYPVLLGLVSERVPRSGSFGLGLMSAVWFAAAGLIAAPVLEGVADTRAHEELPRTSVVNLFRQVNQAFPQLVKQPGDEIQRAAQAARDVLHEHRVTGRLPVHQTAEALQAVVDSGVDLEYTGLAYGYLSSANHIGRRIAFRFVASVAVLLVFVFGYLYLQDRKAG